MPSYLQDYGPVILYVHPGSPAEEAGLVGARRRVEVRGRGYVVSDLRKADFVVAVNGVKVTTKSDLIDRLSKLDPKKKVTLTVRRSRKSRNVKLQPILG